MHPSDRNRLLALVLLGVLLLLLALFTFPVYRETVIVTGQNQTEHVRSFFYKSSAPAGPVTVRARLWLPPLAPQRYTFSPDDCIDALWVNGKRVEDAIIPFCDPMKGRTLNLSSYLHSGTNELELTLKNDNGVFSLLITPSITDNHVLLVLAVLALLLWPLAGLIGRTRTLTAVVFCGSLLFLFSCAITPHAMRGYDWAGHYEYIQYVQTHWALPDPHTGWEFYHPPLYYIMSAALILALPSTILPFPPDIVIVKIVALLCSIASLCLMVGMGRLLFQKEKNALLLPLFIAACTTVPGIVFMAARINNDVLYQLLACGSLLGLLLFWKKPSWSHWIALTVLLSLALLTKGNALLLLMVATLCMMLLRTWSWRKKISALALSACIVVAATGWHAIPRALEERRADAFLIGNIGNLNSALRIPRDVSSFVSFNPIGILAHPYNNPWRDTERRKQFWEYLYRSAFVGEFDFGEKRKPLVTLLLLVGLFVLPLCAYGIINRFRRRDPFALPLTLTLILLLVGHTALRWTSPFASAQDFRYSSLVVVPLIYFAVRGSAALPKNLRPLGFGVLCLLVALCIAFILSLALPL